MNISILCSSETHPVFPVLQAWQNEWAIQHSIELVSNSKSLSGGDILFLISCNEIIRQDVRAKYRFSLVIHASDLPQGRGWSPHIWQVIEGLNRITVTLLEAEDLVDSGSIWAQEKIILHGHELYNEINDLLFDAETRLMDFAVNNFDTVEPQLQRKEEPTYYRKRVPEDSRIEPYRTIEELFDLLRVADPDRFPVFFDLRGHRYTMSISKQSKPGE
jgi:methionyl-tRNA formyltransferase